MLPKTNYLANLTPLRGIAALLVATFHFEMAIARFVPANVTMFFEKSYLMVDLFFIMSGFIIYHVYHDYFKERISTAHFKTFLIARFARIYPLHIFSLLLLVLLVVSFAPAGTWPNPMETTAAIPTNIFLLQSFYIHRIYTWNIPSWSISAEWWAYLLFPLIAVFIQYKKKLAAWTLFVLVVAAYLAIMYLLPRKNPLYPAIPVPHNVNTTYDYGFLRGIAGFTGGVLLYLLYELPAYGRIGGSDWFAAGALAGVVACLHFALNDGITIIFFAALVIAFAGNTGYIRHLCAGKTVQWLGTISYSIYLMQIFLQEPFGKGMRLPGTIGFGRGKQNIAFFSGLGYCVLYLLLLIGISSFTYYCIELPCRRWINRLGGRTTHVLVSPSVSV